MAVNSFSVVILKALFDKTYFWKSPIKEKTMKKIRHHDEIHANYVLPKNSRIILDFVKCNQMKNQNNNWGKYNGVGHYLKRSISFLQTLNSWTPAVLNPLLAALRSN